MNVQSWVNGYLGGGKSMCKGVEVGYRLKGIGRKLREWSVENEDRVFEQVGSGQIVEGFVGFGTDLDFIRVV